NMIFVPFVFIVITYILISFMFIGISSKTGRRKFLSTCSSHLISVCTYYVSLITVYMIPSGENSVNVNKFRSLLYIVGTPLANPIIYSFRNQEIKDPFVHVPVQRLSKNLGEGASSLQDLGRAQIPYTSYRSINSSCWSVYWAKGLMS
ncbi:olfactory receptor 11L1-like, partial [Pelobates cultripes]